MIDLEKIIKKIQAVHKEFHDAEIIELCEDYLSKFPKKTKEESKLKSLNKFIEKEFELDNLIDKIPDSKISNFEIVKKCFVAALGLHFF